MTDHRLLDGRAVRDRILADVAKRVGEAGRSRTIGRLVSVSIGEQKAASVYARSQANSAATVMSFHSGMNFEIGS